MEILFIAATLPYPPTDGAKIRLLSLIKHLAVRHKVSVASFVTSTDHPNAIDHLRRYCKDVQVVQRNSRYPISKIIMGLVGSTPFPVLNYWDPALDAVIKKMAGSTSFDIVQAEGLHAGQYCEGIRGCRVLDMFDLYSVVMKRYADQQGNLLKRFYAEITARKLARYERTISPPFAHCLAASSDDQHFMQKHLGVERVSVIPNGVDLDAYAPDGTEVIEDNRIVFVGRMDYAANIEGAKWFCREVLPLVRAYRSHTLFQIVGKYPTKEVKRLAVPSHVEITGFVEDVRPYLRAAAVSIIPLRIGGGTRIKILESLAMGKAVVSTSVGAEGLAVTPERDILIADDAQGFAKQIVQVIEDAELRKSLGNAGRQLVESRYGWNMIGSYLEAVYEQVLREAHLSS